MIDENKKKYKSTSVVIKSENILKILSKRKNGISVRFAVETALNLLYEDKSFKKMIFIEEDINIKEPPPQPTSVEAAEETNLVEIKLDYEEKEGRKEDGVKKFKFG